MKAVIGFVRCIIMSMLIATFLPMNFAEARHFNPKTGRFLQRDPLGYIDSPNPYSYTLNNPINNTDPFGTATWPVKGKVENEVKKELGKIPDLPLLPGQNRQQTIDEYAREIAKSIPNADALDLAGGRRIKEVTDNLLKDLMGKHPDWPWNEIEGMIKDSMSDKDPRGDTTDGGKLCPK